MSISKQFRSWSVAGQIISVLSLVCIIVVLASNQHVRDIEQEYLIESNNQQRVKALKIIISASVVSVITEDIAYLETLTNELARTNPELHAIQIQNQDRETLVKWSRENKVSDDYLFSMDAPVELEGEVFGHVMLQWNLSDHLMKIEKHVNRHGSFLSLMLALLATISLVAIHFLVIRPIKRIDNYLLSYARGEKDNKSLPGTSREFGHLVKTIDELEKVTTTKETLQKEVASRRNAQIALASARDVALKASRAKSTFLANMSHELRTPLNAILGYSELITEEAEDAGDDDYAKDAKRITAAGSHLLTLINGILDLSKIEAGKMDLDVSEFDLCSMINSTFVSVEPLARKNSNKLDVRCDASIGSIYNDITKLKQIVMNLLSNACKFTKEGNVCLKASRTTHDGQPWIQIAVSDTGIGIDNDALEHIFDSYSQASSSITREFGGTGLGLDISRRFCHMMGGDLSVESVLGKGSTFTVLIPVDPRDTTGIDGEDKFTSRPIITASLSRNGDRENSSTRRNKISQVMIIEPDTDHQENMTLILEAEGFSVSATHSYEDAFELVSENQPDSLIVNAGGNIDEVIGLARRIRESDAFATLPVIATGGALSADVVNGLSIINDIPVDYELVDLVNKVKKSLRR